MDSWGYVRTCDILSKLGYEYVSFEIPPKIPELSDIRFVDLLPELGKAASETCLRIAAQRLYAHQVEGLEALRDGGNLVLKSGTGSGKTEVWFLRSALDDVKALAVYPTLALANDQLNRLKEYCAALGMEVVALDAVKRDELARKIGIRGLREKIAGAQIVITNPAFLLNEVKKMGAGKPCLLKGFLENVGLLVVDDFDFYGPRSIALLFSMIRLLVRLTGSKMQFAFMTATLENPEEIAKYLTSINQMPTKIVDGRPFHPRNVVYIILGKSLKAMWETLRDKLKPFEHELGGDIKMALSDFYFFRNSYFKVLEAAKALGVEIPEPSLDVGEILENYIDDYGVTLVFARNISRAEEIAKKLIFKTDSGRVAAHHHLLSKKKREEIEEAARRGIVKILVSPRTLSQGIDIGLVRRIVHIGLPDSVREFRQREGRKGRRIEIQETETVVVPQGIWDRELLSRGIDAFKKWLELPQEKVIANPENLYGKLFEALFKYNSPTLRRELSEDEIELLRRLGLESGGELTRRGKMTWLKMNFYEFAPAFGIKRIKISRLGEHEYLEDISHVDLVEKFQPGCIDYSSDGVVVEHKLGGKSSRAVTAVYVEDLNEGVMRRYDPLAYVLEEYEKSKWMWGEKPNLRRDYFSGKIHTDVKCVVHAPSNGFNLYTKIPNRVIWKILSDKRAVKVVGDKTITIRESRTLEVPTPTYGMYSDYTYGISFEIDPSEDPQLMRLGLAFLIIALRRLLGIAFDTIEYDIMIMGGRKVVGLHETESAGLLEKLNWHDLAEKIRGYVPDELDEIFLEEVDELAYSSLITLKLDWGIVKSQTLKILDYLILREKMPVEFAGMKLYVPKPSKSLKLASIASSTLILRDDLRSGLYGLALYDGGECSTVVGVTELGKPDQSYSKIVVELSNLIDQGFKVLIYDYSSLSSAMEEAGLTGIKAVLDGLRSMDRVIEVCGPLATALGKKISMEFAEDVFGLAKDIRLHDLIYFLEEEKRRIPHMRFIRNIPKRLAEKLEGYLRSESENLYKIYLIVQELSRRGGGPT